MLNLLDTAAFLECADRLALLAESWDEAGENLKAVAYTMHALVNIKREGRIPNLPGKAFLAVCAGAIVKERTGKKITSQR